MFFLALVADKPGMLEQRLATRQVHLDYWASVPGALKLAGAQLTSDRDDGTPKGSMFLLEADSIEAAQAMIADDPFTTAGIFGDDIRIETVRPAIGEWLPKA